MHVPMTVYQEWMEECYKELLEAFRKTETVAAFHLAEENKKEFPHDEVRAIMHSDM